MSALTRLAYVSPDYSNFIVERGALEGALAVKAIYWSSRMLKNLGNFMAVVVSRVQFDSHKVGCSTSLFLFSHWSSRNTCPS